MSNFHETAEASSIRLDEGHLLRALLRREDGELEEAELDLNCCIGNIDGRFQWGGENFAETSHDIRLENENGQPILRAVLRSMEGEPETHDINLCERIANRDGKLCFE